MRSEATAMNHRPAVQRGEDMLHAPKAAPMNAAAFPATAAGALVTAAAWTIFTGDLVPMIVGLGCSLAIIEIGLLVARAQGFTATILPVAIINLILLGGLVLWPTVAADAIVSVRLAVEVEVLVTAAFLGMLFTAAFTVGALVVGMTGGSSVRFSSISDIRIPTAPLLFLTYAALGLTVFARGETLLRGGYLDASGPDWAIIASNSLTPLAIAAACVAVFRPGASRLLALVGLIAWVIVLYGRSSRTLASVPILLLFGWFISTGRRVRWFHLAGALVATFLLLQFPLALRSTAGGVGILTLTETLLANPDAVYGAFNVAGLLGNLLFSAPLTGIVAGREVDQSTLWVSLTPIGGEAAGWSDVSDELRIDATTPFNTIGELAAHGPLTLTLVAFAVGASIALAERIAASLPGKVAAVAMILPLAIAALYSVRVLQYNLRSSTRLIWYMLFAMFAIWVVSLVLHRSQAKRAAQLLSDRHERNSRSETNQMRRKYT